MSSAADGEDKMQETRDDGRKASFFLLFSTELLLCLICHRAISPPRRRLQRKNSTVQRQLAY